MKSADYKCECEYIETMYIKDTEKFPEKPVCKICGRTMKRKYTSTPYICHQGRCGNNKNGYTSNEGHVRKT